MSFFRSRSIDTSGGKNTQKLDTNLDKGSSAGAADQMKSYDQYAQQSMGANAAETMQKAQAASAQTAQAQSDAAVQQALKAAKTGGAMGGQAALAASGQAANAYNQAQQAAQNQYLNATQLGGSLGSEMSKRLQSQEVTNLQKYNTDVGAQQSAYATKMGAQTAQRGQNIGLLGSAIGAVGGIASVFSDKNVKTDIRKNNPTDGLASLKSYTYKYKKGPAYDGGKLESGIIAQELEKTAMKPAVVDTKDGKMIDTRKLTTMNTGALAEHERRMKQIEDILKVLAEEKAPGSK